MSFDTKLFIKGFIVGSIDIVAGVSGGTMAMVLGVYRDLIHALRRFDTRAVRLLFRRDFAGLRAYIPWKFLCTITSGVLAAVIVMARLLNFFFEVIPVTTWSVLSGIVFGSAIIVGKSIGRLTFSKILAVVGAGMFAWIFVTFLPSSTPNTWWFFIITGMVGIAAALLPGLSGAFTLILLGKYTVILDAVNHFRLDILVFVALGAAIGLFLFIRVVDWLLERHFSMTMAVVTGLMLGSLRKLWPWRAGEIYLSPYSTWSIVGAILVCFLGILFVLGIRSLAQKNTPGERV